MGKFLTQTAVALFVMVAVMQFVGCIGDNPFGIVDGKTTEGDNGKDGGEKEPVVIDPVCDDSKTAINAQYVRAEYFYSDEWPPSIPITIIPSRSELEEHYEQHRRRVFNGRGDLLPDENFLNAIKGYTDDYFADNYLVIVGLTEGSGSIRHEVEKICKNGEIVINRLIPEIGTADMASWSIIIERNNCFQVEQFHVTLVSISCYTH
ncbi:MAG: hypothetical protein LBC70_00675 [Chitinispirillales bacterium]|jgi:hypothetical protein|nr:hypothetical protein [Chitinispirillales bacterium]